MNVHVTKDIVPINLAPGDNIELTYTDVDGSKHVLLQDPVREYATVDRVAAATLDEAEAAQTGMRAGALAGIFGRRAKNG